MGSQLSLKPKRKKNKASTVVSPKSATETMGLSDVTNKIKGLTLDANHKDETLPTLCRDFKRHYWGYEDYLKEADFLDNPDIMAYVLFGTSGAGKSTTVARLLEDSPPAEFLRQLEEDVEAERKTSVINDIAIGHSLNDSCTVEPRPYVFQSGSEELVVCDMPGFAEADPDKKIIIDVLQKCFMTRVPTSRPLIVVEMDSIFEMRLTKLKENYHSALSTMLGSKYKDAIDHFYFLVTKCDDDVSHKDIERQLREIVWERTESDNGPDATLCTKFFRRMAKSFVTVDLKRDDNKTLLKKITDKIEAERNERELTRRFDVEWKIEKLDSGENELNRRCLEYIKASSQLQAQIERETKKLQVEWNQVEQSLRTETEAHRVSKEEAVKRVRDLKGSMQRIQLNVASYPERRASLTKQLDEKKEVLKVHKTQLQVFHDNFTSIDFIHVRADKSEEAPKQGRQRNKPSTHSVLVNCDLKLDASADSFILVTEEPASLSNFIDKEGKVKAKKMEEFRNADFDKDSSVIYHSNGLNRCNAEYNKEKGMLRIVITNRPKPFWVYVFTSRPFQSMRFFGHLEKHFHDEVRKDQEAITALNSDIAAVDDAHTANLKTLDNLAMEFKEASAVVHDLQRATHTLQTKHHEEASKTKDKVVAIVHSIEEREGDKLADLIEEVIGIFVNNKIETDCQAPLKDYKERFGLLRGMANTTEKAVSGFLTADMDKILNIQGFSA